MVLEKGIFGLLEATALKNSAGWDTYLVRMDVWACSKDKKTEKEFFYFDPHLDRLGEMARTERVRLVVIGIKKIASDKPTFLNEISFRPNFGIF